MSNPLHAELSRQLLRYAVQRQMFDGQTGEVLDIRTAVLVEVNRGDGSRPVIDVMTGARFDATIAGLVGQPLKPGWTIEVWDGRLGDDLYRLYSGDVAAAPQSESLF